MTIRYEDLLADGAKELARLCEFVGVDRDPAVLEVHAGHHDFPQRGAGDRAAVAAHEHYPPRAQRPRQRAALLDGPHEHVGVAELVGDVPPG